MIMNRLLILVTVLLLWNDQAHAMLASAARAKQVARLQRNLSIKPEKHSTKNAGSLCTLVALTLPAGVICVGLVALHNCNAPLVEPAPKTKAQESTQQERTEDPFKILNP